MLLRLPSSSPEFVFLAISREAFLKNPLSEFLVLTEVLSTSTLIIVAADAYSAVMLFFSPVIKDNGRLIDYGLLLQQLYRPIDQQRFLLFLFDWKY